MYFFNIYIVKVPNKASLVYYDSFHNLNFKTSDTAKKMFEHFEQKFSVTITKCESIILSIKTP